MKNRTLKLISCLVLALVMLLCEPTAVCAAEFPHYDYSSFHSREKTWILTPGDDTGMQFYNLVDTLHYTGYGPDVKDKTYITEYYGAYLSDDGYFWEDCKTKTYTDGTYFVYRFAQNYNNWYLREDVIHLRVRYMVNVTVSGAPSGYGGVLKDGENVSSLELMPGETVTLEVVPIPGHKATVTYGSAGCTVSGNKYTFKNVDRNIDFKVVYEAVDFASVTFAQPANATVSVNGSSSSPVSVVSGMPFTVTVTAKTGSFVSGMKVDGEDQGVSGKQVSVTKTGGAKGTNHTVSVTTETVTLEVRSTAEFPFDTSATAHDVAKEIFKAMYISSTGNYTVDDVRDSSTDGKPVTVQVYGSTDAYVPMDHWVSLTDDVEYRTLFKEKGSVRARLTVGNQVSAVCTLMPYNNNIGTDTIRKDYTGKPVSESLNRAIGGDFSWTSTATSAYLANRYDFFDSNKQALDAAPVEPGSYYVRVSLVETWWNEGAFIPYATVSTYSPLIPLTITMPQPYAVKNVSGSKTYDGQAAAPSFTVVLKGNTETDWNFTDGVCANFPYTVTYSHEDASGHFVEGLPRDAGTYTVRVTVDGLSAEGSCTVDPKAVTALVTVADKTYDGNTSATVVAAVDTGIDGEEIWISGLYGAFAAADASDAAISVALDKSAMTLTAVSTQLSNFTVTVPDSAIGMIFPAALSNIRVKQTANLTYNGMEQTTGLTATADSVNQQTVTFTYSDREDGSYGALPGFTQAGEYTCWYQASAPNHKTVTGSFTVTVKKQRVDPPVLAGKVYTGQPQTADVPESPLYTLSRNPGGTDSGSYDVVLTLADPTNYTWPDSDSPELTLEFQITQAENAWLEEPAITGWTYGESPNAPTFQAKFGQVAVRYTGTANDSSTWDSDEVPTKAGSYQAVFTVEETPSFQGLQAFRLFTVEKADYDMSGAGWDYEPPLNYTGLPHTLTLTGLPTGVAVAAYTENQKVDVGSYTASAALVFDDANYNAPSVDDLEWEIVNTWIPREYTFTQGHWLKDTFTLTPQEGYLISTGNQDNSLWSDSLSFQEETLPEGSTVTFYLRRQATGEISLAGQASWFLDKTPPTGTVTVDTLPGWTEMHNSVTFDRFFNRSVTVKAEGQDLLSGVTEICYALSQSALTPGEVEAITQWEVLAPEGISVTAEDGKQFVCYIRLVDGAGNIAYLSTDGVTFDTTAPTVTGVEDGAVCYTTQSVTAADENLAEVTVNGQIVTGSFSLEGNRKTTYTVTARDLAGNVTTLTVQMHPVDALGKPAQELNEDNVTSLDTQTLQDILENAGKLLADPDTTAEEKEVLENIQENAQGLLDHLKAAENASVTRIYGDDRYATSLKTAEELKQALGVEQFRTVIVARGSAFADALSGSYLANRKNAPILLVKEGAEENVKDYIRENLAPGGTVYILGGTQAVSAAMETGLEGFTVKRLGGADRYETNLLILRETGVGTGDILIATGKTYADSLSASAVDLPILLAGWQMNEEQLTLLRAASGKKIIIGGEDAISARVEAKIRSTGETLRIGGADRYETSVLLAKRFFPEATTAVLAYGGNFPDGLSGGPLANARKAPLLLTKDQYKDAAEQYLASRSITSGTVLGGRILLDNSLVRSAFALNADDPIRIK